MTQPTQAQIEAKVGNGKVIDCYLKPRSEDELMFYGRGDGTIVAYLEGYAIIPREEYAALAAVAAPVGEQDDIDRRRFNATIERCAQVADEYGLGKVAGIEIAAAIRKLKDAP